MGQHSMIARASSAPPLWWGRVVAVVLALAAASLAATSLRAATLELVNGEETLELTLEDLLEMPQHEILTENEFVDQMTLYRGPLARDVLARAGLDGADRVRFTALNDYYIEIPASDFERFDVILALEADGRRLSRRDKGPIWLMYPISDHDELADPRYYGRLIWQVFRIEGL